MRVFDQNKKEVASTALNMECIQFDGIDTDGIETVLIPYKDAEFLDAVSSLVYDVVWTNQPVWMIADNENSKLSLFITANGTVTEDGLVGFDVKLSIEAIPCRYDDEEENQHILSEAKRGKGVIGFLGDYDTWVVIIASSKAWHSKENNYGENWVYDMELTEEELKMLQPIVNKAFKDCICTYH